MASFNVSDQSKHGVLCVLLPRYKVDPRVSEVKPVDEGEVVSYIG